MDARPDRVSAVYLHTGIVLGNLAAMSDIELAELIVNAGPGGVDYNPTVAKLAAIEGARRWDMRVKRNAGLRRQYVKDVLASRDRKKRGSR